LELEHQMCFYNQCASSSNSRLIILQLRWENLICDGSSDMGNNGLACSQFFFCT